MSDEDVKVAECRFGAALLAQAPLEVTSAVLTEYLALRARDWNPREECDHDFEPYDTGAGRIQACKKCGSFK